MTLRDRRVVVLGLGITGWSAVRWSVRHGARVAVADTRADPPHAADLRAQLPEVPLTTGPIVEATLAGAQTIVISPGLAKDQPAIQAAVARGAELVGDVELFARALPPGQKVLAVTGSNGKTTVTALTATLLRASGLLATTVGNIGEPVLEALAGYEQGVRWPDVFVIELSSFQLETTSSLKPVAATVLNVTENHLDRYPGLAEYAAAKARIFGEGGDQILNRDDARSLAMARPGRIIQTFGAGAPRGEREWGLVERKGVPWLAHGGEPLIAAGDLALVGRHNALNALAALALASTVARVEPRMLAALAAFHGLPHRMERIADIAGVAFVNDSKGTTVAATQAALEGIGRRVVLIAGGDGKGQDFRPLKQAVEAHCRAVVLLGRDAPALRAALAGGTPAVELVATLEAAVGRAIAIAQPGDAVLLSPACASLDMFNDYVHRGERFRAAVAVHVRDVTHA